MTSIDIKDKGTLTCNVDDWGGDYPGIDVEFYPNQIDKSYASNPRVLIEWPKGEFLHVAIWQDPTHEDCTHVITFPEYGTWGGD